jgi:hypothetical protein
MGDMAMDEWKDKQIKSCIVQTNYKHSEGGYGRLPLGNVYTCHDFQEHTSLKKLVSKHFFPSLLKDLLTKDLVTLGNFLSTKYMEPSRQLYATPSRRVRVPQDIKNKMLKQLVNR